MKNNVLIESIQEGGPMSLEECQKVLAGMGELPQMRAVVSLIESAIGQARNDAEILGQSSQSRDEACGASVHLRCLREQVKELLKSQRREDAERESEK